MSIYKRVIDLLAKREYDSDKIVVELAKQHPSIFLRLAATAVPTSTIEKQVLDAYHGSPTNSLVTAIKYYRSVTNTSLKEAKEKVEEILEKHGVI